MLIKTLLFLTSSLTMAASPACLHCDNRQFAAVYTKESVHVK